MKTRLLRTLSLLTLTASLILPALALAADKDPKPAQSIPELKAQIEKILADSHTPGAAVAIVHKGGPEWVTGLGLSDVATKHATSSETLFRIGSTSKAFTALSVLKLIREGKLSLDTPVHQLAPEIYFENKWEETNPVRVVDLLEHTTGWDDMHLAEYATDAKGWTLKQGLDYYKKSRISRWPPGTRMSYCNSGPAVAAYIVEKITGQRFEDYVHDNFFEPIGMNSATYFEAPSPLLTTLYHDDGKTPYPYWNILLRPAGSINASATDMANYLQFYLNRGLVNGTPLVPAAQIDRMEIPTRSWAAQSGLNFGYGLHNYSNVHEGFVWHGHNGGVQGGLTDMSYMPDYGVGYFFSINSGNGDAFGKIGKAIRAYITRNLAKPALEPAQSLPANIQDYAGWYEPNSPRNQVSAFLERIAGLTYFSFKDGNMIASDMNQRGHQMVHIGALKFRDIPKDGLPDPIATNVLIAPNSDGRFLYAGGTYKKIPLLEAWAEILLTALFALAFALSVLYLPFWFIGGLFKSRRKPDERAFKIWTLIATLSLVLFCLVFVLASSDLILNLGRFSVYSVGAFFFSLLFALATLAAIFSCFRSRGKQVRNWVRWLYLIILLPYLVAVIYLLYWGVIGIRLWA